MTQTVNLLRQIAEGLIAATNAFDVDGALRLFSRDAVIDDPSTGLSFNGHSGIRTYIERYFIGYQTVTRLLTLDVLDNEHCRIRVDFTGSFGHEVGLLIIHMASSGLIDRIDADLE
jgi:hypothetical protein